MSMGERYPAASARNSPNSVITVYRCEMPSLIFPDGVRCRRWQNRPISLSYIASRPRIANSTSWATRVSALGAATVFVISRNSFLYEILGGILSTRFCSHDLRGFIMNRWRSDSVEFDDRDNVLDDGFERRAIFFAETLLLRIPAHSLDLRPYIVDGFEQNETALLGKIGVNRANFPAKNAINRYS